MKLILDPASCKPIFVALHPPLSSLPTQQQHVLHVRKLHITHSVGNERQIYPSLSIATARNFLLSAAIGLYLPRSCLWPRISQTSVFRPDVSCFTLVHHPVLHDDQLGLLLHSGDSARPLTADNRRYGAKGYRSVRLSVGQALPVSRYACAHCCCCCTSAHVGGGPSSTTNERWLPPFFLDTQAS